MPSTLFLQSDISDPYLIYQSMLDENPVYWDEINQIWAIYSYDYCVEILQNTVAQIPIINSGNEQKLNKHALEILDNLARLSNGLQHQIAREIALLLFSRMKNIDVDKMISQLIEKDLIDNKTDWVDSVCKKLSILILLKSFSFQENDADFISEKIETLVKIMLPKKTDEQVKLINDISEEMHSIVEKQLDSLHFYKNTANKLSVSASLSLDEIKKISISNLIGLFIQSYDAGRGILSNSFLQIIQNKIISDKTQIEKAVIETLRFNPPIHNTRRIATEDILINENLIKKNDSILIVLASANRDPKKFENASNFDIERNNNNENITFGIGGHMCLAKHFSIQITTAALYFLFNQYKTITLLENNMQYEPMINARLPKNIWISLQ